MMSLRSGSSRRKPQVTHRVNQKSARNEDAEEEEDEVSNGSEEGEVRAVKRNGKDDDQTDEDVEEIPDLPEGTIIVNPEPVDDRPKSFGMRKQRGTAFNNDSVSKSFLARVTCTACGKQVNPHIYGAARRHPHVKALICKKCYKFYKSGEITKDEDGLDEQCRWCGEGGKLFGCDYCHNVFCKACIQRNFGRGELSNVDVGDAKWKCYICSPRKMADLIEHCNKVLDYMEKEREKEKEMAKKEKQQTIKSSAPKSESESLKHSSSAIKSEPGGSGIVGPSKILQSNSSSRGPQVSQTTNVQKQKPVPVKAEIVQKTSSQNFGVMRPGGSRSSQPALVHRERVVPPPVVQMNNSSIDDLKRCLLNVNTNNVQDKIDKFVTVVKSMSLMLEAIKTDLAIAQLSGQYDYGVRSNAVTSLSTGMEVFFNAYREILGKPPPLAQVATESPAKLAAPLVNGNRFKIDTSTPLVTKYVRDVKKELNISAIPIMIDESDEGGESPKKTSRVNSQESCGKSQSVVSLPVEVDEDDDGTKTEENPAKVKSAECLSENPSKKTSSVTSENIKWEEKSESGKENNENSKDEDEDCSEEDDDVDERKPSGKIKFRFKKVEKKKEMDEDTENLSKLEDKLKSVIDSIENENEMSDQTESDSNKEWKRSRKSQSSQEKVEKDNKDGSAKIIGSGDNSENIAAQLELLKEMADELSEKTEKAEMNSQQDDSATETEETNEKDRISDRKEKKKEDDDEDVSDFADGRKSDTRRSRRKKSRDNTVHDKKNAEDDDVNVKSKKGRSSKYDKSEKEDDDLSVKRKGKNGKKVESRDETVKTDDGKTKKKKQAENDEKNLSGEKSSKSKIKEEKMDGSISDDDDDDDDSSEEEETRRRTRRSKKRQAAEKKSEKKKKCKSDSENYDSELEQEIEKFEKEPVLRRSSRKTQEMEKEKDKKGKEDRKSKSEQKLKGDKKSKKKEDEDESLSFGSDNDSNKDVDEEEEEEDNSQNILDAENEAAKLALLQEADNEDKEKEEEEDMDEDNEDGFEMPSSDSEVTFTPRKTRGSVTKDKESKKTTDDSDDSNDQPVRKTRLRSKLLDAKLSEGDSEDDDDEDEKKTRKGKGKGKKRKKESSEEDDYQDAFDDDDGSDIEGPVSKKKGKKRTKDSSDEESESDSSSKKRSYKQKGKKRRRIKLITNSSDEETEDQEKKEKVDKKQDSENEGGDDDDDEGGHSFLKRRRIRKLMSNKKLAEETKQARKAEEERRKRIDERQKLYNRYIEVEDGDKEGTDEGKKLLGSPIKCPVTTKLVMQVDEKTKDPIIEMDRTLVRKLKPHQVEAVQFIWNCCVENVDRLKKEEGSGCILAHCMGLGKTLSVISFLHMMMANQKQTKIKCCLVVCPLNTILNWQREFEMWQEDLQYQMDVYELSLVKQNFSRADRLQDWHESGGVMIMGYDMYRRLATGHKQKKKGFAKKKRLCEIFQETLVDPGPDIVVCDEGHILKNDSSAISKAMSEIKTKRRIVLTGTPLQNNLGEYHCMVNFVKTNLLGTRREFANRFINPITNGQCSDSTPFDVKIMKRRAHILHEMLAGCVQRKDYSALTKFLPPKFEYVINVRLSKVQIELYEKYLELSLKHTDGVVTGRGGRLFTDYQFLMRIWTHPWVLKLDEIRQENRRTYDSEDSFIDDEADTDEESDMSFIDNSSEVSGEENSDTIDSDEDGRKKAKDKQKKAEDENKDEIVKKWTTRSRRGDDEDGAGPSQPLKEEEFQFDKCVSSEWWAEYVKEEDKFKMDTGGKLVLLFQILKMCEDIGDKVLVFSQSLLSLDIIEDFLEYLDSEAQKEHENANNDDDKEKKEEKEGEKNKDDELKEFGKNWSKGVDYFRLDGSTNPQNRKKYADSFNDIENYRARLFLISTKAGSLGINLVAANRVIIFDASWNPSHDIQSMFRVYRFGQEKPVYIYRFLAQGTMEEKIYERQVTKQSLSLRVIDENQIERHFSASDLQELYTFTPDRLDDPNRKEKPTPKLPKDVLLAELLQSHKDWIVGYHDHDSLLENIEEDKLTEEERKAAWEEYEEEKKGIRVQNLMVQPGLGLPPMPGAYNQGFSGWHGGMFPQGMPNLGPNGLLQIVNDLKIRFPGMPPELFQQRVQAVLRQLLAQQIMQQQEAQRRQVEQRQMQELQRLNQIKQQIQRQRQQIAVQQSQMGLSSLSPLSMYGASQPLPTLNTNMPSSSTLSNMLLGQNVPRSQPKS
ncbi:hypothetical protein ACJMK2_032269 [Sinanodonta woodiana]|uniref:ATP-dependent helicase ATRX n=1 Tax=Sinanodonta woodiana TaxID=1069815 RepID=A0ABD3X4N8_SINWO